MTEWKDVAERLQNRIKSINAAQVETMNEVAETGLTLAGAGIAGYIHGRKGGMPTYGGIPLDLLVAGASGIVGLAGWAGGYSPWLLAFGNGWGAYYVGTLAAGKGLAARKNAKKADGTPEYLGREYTAEEQRAQGIQARAPVMAGANDSGGYPPGFVNRWAA